MAATPKGDLARGALIEVLADVDGTSKLLAIVREDGAAEQVCGLEASLGRDADGIIAGLARRGLVIVQADDGK